MGLPRSIKQEYCSYCGRQLRLDGFCVAKCFKDKSENEVPEFIEEPPLYTQHPYNDLTLGTLANANRARLPEFRNSKGEIAHAKPDGSDWSPAQWLQAVIGELGEYANIRKKFERGDLLPENYVTCAAKELADVQTYLSILAMRCLDTPLLIHPTGIDLGLATINKFNEVSERVGSEIRLTSSSWHRVLK